MAREASLDGCQPTRRRWLRRPMTSRHQRPASSLIVGLVLCMGIQTMRAFAQEPHLSDVLRRAGAYVAVFNDDLASIVAEERYVQRWSRPSVLPGTRGDAVSQRELVSDLMLVRPASAAAWLQYRDVFEVDSVAVRDRAERLTKLLVSPSASTEAQVARIQEESARHNLGDIERTFNTPVFALQFLETEHQRRFRFTRADATTPATTRRASDDSGAFRVSTEVWVIRYEELVRPSIIHTVENADVPARGRFWIEPESGRVLMSELVVGERDRQGTVTVSYQSEPYLGLLVPIEMREQYEERRRKSRIDAVATYGRFRKVDEPIREPARDPRTASPTRSVR